VGRGARGMVFILAGILLTLAAIVGRELLPRRTLDVPGFRHYLFLAENDPEGRRVSWIDERRLAFRCHFDAADANPNCSLGFFFNPYGSSQGIDLRRYRWLTLDLAYRGRAQTVRVAVRSFDPRFAHENDANSARIQTTNLRVRDIQHPLTIDLDELIVPEWWIGQYNLPREYNVPGLDNAISLTLDLPGLPVGEEHQLEVRRLAIEGEWIGSEALYLGILCAWMVGGVVIVAWRWTALARQHRRQGEELEALVARTARLRSEQASLRRQANVDALTGVLNRRGLDEALTALEAAGGDVALLVLDIDHFKRVNDRHGHDLGDQVLRRVAGVMAQNVRADDVVGRWGGEEFLVACPNCGLSNASAVAEKIRLRIEASAFGARERIAVTASLGVAVMEPGESHAEAFRRADAALYRAKSGGRNRVVVDAAEPARPPSKEAERSA
jgi:diguanylate cyclase (GGDEF)-like protein